jgi:uncharacterized membrane protein YphA (DoxX/SURF4 family)
MPPYYVYPRPHPTTGLPVERRLVLSTHTPEERVFEDNDPDATVEVASDERAWDYPLATVLLIVGGVVLLAGPAVVIGLWRWAFS